MTIAAVFPGQGSQVIGIGIELAQKFDVARKVFNEVNEAIGENLFKIMQSGDEKTLQLTENAQPALMSTGIAVVRVLEYKIGRKIGEVISHTAGHSLGEYTSLVASESLKLSDAARLLRIRGKAMQSAVPVGIGSMVAIIGASIEDVEHFIASAGNTKEVVEIANDNAPGQIVISGHSKSVDLVLDIAKKSGVRKALKLSVSAPFHSSMMNPAALIMSNALDKIKISEPKIPIICNVTAVPETAPNILKQNLILQVTGKVRWRETMESMVRLGVNQVVEMGTGKVLTGLARRCDNNLTTVNLQTSDDIIKWLHTENNLR